MRSNTNRFSLILGMGLAAPAAVFAAGLQMLVQPVYPPDQSLAVHQPLADYLVRRTGQQIVLVTPRDFHHYWLEIRAGRRYDLSLDDAHITALHIRRESMQPLARAAEEVRYFLLAADPEINRLNDLIGRPVASLPAPSLGHQILSRWFTNPMSQPQITSSAKSWLDAVEMVFSLEADAAIAPIWLAERYPNLHAIAESDAMPGMTINAGNHLAPDVVEQIRQALLELNEESADFSVLNELNTSGFKAAETADYSGLDRYLDTLFQL